MRIALATCERSVERDKDFDYIAPALRRRGAEAEAPAWTDPEVDWSAFDLVLVSSTWDYHTQADRFLGWLRSVDARTLLRNELKTIEWNIDKRYLRELDAAGVPVIPTVWIEAGADGEAKRAIAAEGWSDIIVKPVVDLGAKRLARVRPDTLATVLEHMDEPAMAQPFLNSVEGEGELSILVIDGEPHHALRKSPARGDFRVQPIYGGTHERIEPPPEGLEIARAALAVAPGDPLYARVDLLADADGGLRLIELELIEPAFYLDVAPAGAELMARAILAAARRG